MLWGREQQCGVLDGLLADVRAGRSRVLVVRGEPGIGKTALLGYAAGTAPGFRVARAEGVESEMELPFAALHQLCGRMLSRLGRLPGPQREALGVAFGLCSGSAPDRFLVGLAVLGLLSETAAEQPLLCLVDDAQWLDQASAQVLAFVARRLDAETVAMLLGTRDLAGEGGMAGLPGLVVAGLADADARALLASVIPGRLDERVRDRIIAESGGNPLALLELPHGVTAAELAGGFGLPGAEALSGRIEDSFARRLAPLPAKTRRLLLLAAAEPAGDPALLWRAARRLGISADAAAPAEADGLLSVGAQVTFRHPLARSAVYQAAPATDRRRAHHAIAEATDPGTDPDRRAWHRAQAAAGPDEDIAAELERSASRAQARGGLAAAAAFLDRAVTLTPEPPRRAERTLAAAQAKYQAGAFDAALQLLATAEAGPLDELQRARADLLRGQIAFASSRGSDAPPLLLKAARQFELLDERLARETYLEALSAALFAGRLALGGGVRTRADGPFPLITLVHGGPDARYADQFMLAPHSPGQWLATAGYAVFLPNPRGGVGHGRDFAATVARSVGGSEWSDIISGIDLLIAEGVADPDWLGIGGASHGGFMAAWAIGQTDRFKAAMMAAGISDWGMLVATGEGGTLEAELSGSCGWEGTGPHPHDQVSPISFASKIRTPVLIVHGEDDTNVPVSQAIYFHRALSWYGAEHELVIYPREGHGLAERNHQLDLLRRTRAWFDRWLRDETSDGRGSPA